MLNSTGTLTIRCVTGGAYPVSGALVRIIGAEEQNRMIAYALLTDVDGLTETLVLPAPDKEYSLSPLSPQMPYSVYDVTVSADGYVTKRIVGVTVFSDVNSLQEINMIPGGIGNGGNYPLGNINTEIPNSDLE